MKRSTTAIFGVYLVLLQQTIAADTSPLLFARQVSGTCNSGSKLCGNGCIDNTWTCCPDKAGGCPPSEYCVLGTNGEYGCCPTGETCVGNGGAITSQVVSSGIIVSTADSGPISGHATGQPFTTGASIGIIGTDGTTRYCSTGSYLCPASVNYGCCPNGDGCGLTNCPTLGSMTSSFAATTTISSLSSVVAVTSLTSATIGQVISSGSSIGTVGTDGTTRYCTTGSYLCPASLNYGCCPNTDACGLTNCPHLSTTLASGSIPALITTTQAVIDGVTTSLGIGVPFTTGGSVGVLGTDATVRYCTTGSYLCPASLNYGCCPNTDACGLTDCPHTTQTVFTSTTANNIGATITGSTAIGVVGIDGTTRFCTTGSSLCAASLNYGCCKDGYACGLTNCVPMSGSSIYAPTTTADSGEGGLDTTFFNTIQTGNVYTDSAKPLVGATTATTSATSSVPSAKSSATIVGFSVPFAIGAIFVLIATLAFGL